MAKVVNLSNLVNSTCKKIKKINFFSVEALLIFVIITIYFVYLARN